jgi:hypothetical protein
MVNKQLLSYNRVLNFILGDQQKREVLSMKEYTIKQFLNNGEQFIYIRRHKTELKDITSYFNDISNKFPKHKLIVKGWEFWIDNKLAGWAIPLSTWQQEKSNTYERVTTLVYDDFLNAEPYLGKYLKNEVGSLLNFMDTVIRTRDNVKCFCIGQTNEIINPYFIYFGLMPNPSKKFNVNNDIVIEFCKTDKSYKTTNNEMFISEKPKNPIFLFSINYKNDLFGCWYNEDHQSMFISHLYLSQDKVLYVDSLEPLKTRVYLKDFKMEFTIKKLFLLFKQGDVLFHNKPVRKVFYEIFKQLLR